VTKRILFSAIVMLSLSACGLKVINPNNKNPNEGTLALDVDNVGVKVVSTYSCKVESMGNRFWGMGKTEEDARNEVMAKCRDKTMISFCKVENVTCVKN